MNLLLVAQLACSLRVYFQTRAVEHRMGFTQDGNLKRPLIGPTLSLNPNPYLNPKAQSFGAWVCA